MKAPVRNKSRLTANWKNALRHFDFIQKRFDDFARLIRSTLKNGVDLVFLVSKCKKGSIGNIKREKMDA